MRGVGAGVDREEQAGVAQIVVELLARDAGLDRAVEVLGVDREHPVHARHVERDAAARRVDMAFERGAGAEGDDRHAMLGADPHDLLHLLGRLGEDHGVGRLRRDVGGGVRVLLADRLAGLEALAETLLQDAEHGGDAGLVAFDRG